MTREDPSAEHRRKLEALFSGGSTASRNGDAAPHVDLAQERPQASPRVVFASPRKSLGRSPSEYRLRLERLRIAREDDEIKEAADVFLAHHQLPDDVDILYKLLRHPCEKVLREAMGQISSLLMQGRINSTILLEDHLQRLQAQATESATMSYIEGLQAQVQKRKDKVQAR